MADLLIRDVDDDVLAVIDAKARKLGISRTEYLRRTLAREGTSTNRSVTVADLSRFADAFAGLADADLMRRAWE